MAKFIDAHGNIIRDGEEVYFNGHFPDQIPMEKRIRSGIAIIDGDRLVFAANINNCLQGIGLYWDLDGEPCYDLVVTQTLRERWGEAVDVIIAECSKVHFGGNCTEFLNHCTSCGGNWVGMYLTGIERLYPAVYAAIPQKLGRNGAEAFENLAYVLQLCGVNTAE